jgi:hypothetical protein
MIWPHFQMVGVPMVLVQPKLFRGGRACRVAMHDSSLGSRVEFWSVHAALSVCPASSVLAA